MKYKDIPVLREQLLIEQSNLCLLCGHPIDPAQAALDHCHKRGTIRGVLHKSCNLLLGKIENSLTINKITPQMLVNICNNLTSYTDIQREEVHPRHLTKLRKRARKTLKKKK